MNNTLFAWAGAAAIVAIVAFLFASQPQQLGSVNISHEYIATSTAADSAYGAFTSGRLIKSGPGSLGSVVITGANTGVLNFYNATTSNVNSRSGQKATSTILIASIPASAAAGTYVLDARFSDGLLLVVNGGNMPTTSITYR